MPVSGGVLISRRSIPLSLSFFSFLDVLVGVDDGRYDEMNFVQYLSDGLSRVLRYTTLITRSIN